MWKHQFLNNSRYCANFVLVPLSEHLKLLLSSFERKSDDTFGSQSL